MEILFPQIDFVPVRRFDAKQVVKETIIAMELICEIVHAAVPTRNVKHVEVHVCLHQGVDRLQ
jgi:hypothetical protein